MHTTDRTEIICGSRVQHGPLNRRIYVMHLDTGAVGQLLPALDRLADDRGYEKITARIPRTCWPAFRAAGYVCEAQVPGFFNGRIDALFVARFLSPRRMAPDRVGDGAVTGNPPPALAAGSAPTGAAAAVSACTPVDAEALGRLFRETFASYPFPVHRAAFLRQAMAGDVFYFCIRIADRIAAAAAAETDPDSRSCEMTDFATRSEYRRRGFAGKLLGRMHDCARGLELKTAYTIARADSRGMNRVFRKRGYRFAGRLVKNTHIHGRIRDMNVWYRIL